MKHSRIREEVATCISDIDAFEAETRKQIDFPYKSRSHRVFSCADGLLHHRKIVDAAEDTLWPDIICYHAILWIEPQNLILSYVDIKAEHISF